jgi:sugar phosphate isomerase/epimerase
MLPTRRGFLAVLGFAASAGTPKIRAGCLATPDSFDNLVLTLKEIAGLGYSGYATSLRLLQSQSGQVDEARAQLGPIGLDLIGVRAPLPHYAELGLDRALDEIARLAMAARQFGARTLMAHSPGLAADGKFAPEALDAKAKFLDAAGKRCIETGLLLNYRTQDAEFQNEAAEIAGLLLKTDARLVYFDFGLVHPAAIDFFRDHPARTFSLEGQFGDREFPAHELAAAIKHTRWISWLIETSAQPGEAARSGMKKIFGV